MKKTRWNPYNVDITVSDMHQIAKFFKIVKNYIKINRLTTNTKKASKQLPFAYNGLQLMAVSVCKWEENSHQVLLAPVRIINDKT